MFRAAFVRVRPAYAGEGRYFVRVPEGAFDTVMRMLNLADTVHVLSAWRNLHHNHILWVPPCLRDWLSSHGQSDSRMRCRRHKQRALQNRGG